MNDPDGEKITCGACGGGNITSRMVEHTFPYGIVENQVMLKATVPLRTCECGMEFYDWVAEEAMDKAVREYLEK